MLIDWFTVSAQVINFLILVWLLQRFLYKPILHAIDERERKINDQIQQAELAKTQAQQSYDEFQQKNNQWNEQRETLLNKTLEETQDLRQRSIEEVRQETNALRARWLESLKNQQSNINQHVASQVQQEVFSISRKILNDLASIQIEQAIVQVFIGKLHELKQTHRDDRWQEKTTRVKSRFDLSFEQKESIQSAIKQVFSSETEVQFSLADELIAGIELTFGGYQLAWSIADYLGSLETRYEEILQEMH